jgi:Xaa-Pro aminopeptidase
MTSRDKATETRVVDDLVSPARLASELERRRTAAAAVWSLRHEVVLIGAGHPLPVPGRADRTYPFRVHSEYLYLTDRERPAGVLAFDPAGGWFDFVEPVTRAERLWEGATPEDDGLALSDLDPWLAERRQRPIACLGAPVPEVDRDEELELRLRRGLNEVRRAKDRLELGRMRKAEAATRAAFSKVASQIEPGVSERAIQIELEAELFRNGGDFLAFETIVAGGANAAVLHFPPTQRQLGQGELVLIDAGAEHRGYASDVTRTYPVSGTFTRTQAELAELVRAAGLAAIESCRAGAEFFDVDQAAAVVLARGLAEFGLLCGEPESLVEQGAVSLFFPHGIGHMVGLGIRDAGGSVDDREPRGRGFVRLRVDLPLRPGYVVTIEPGVYFVPALLYDDELRQAHRDAVNWERAEALIDFGGIRIEDNVLVTEEGCEVLTADIPDGLTG